MHTALQKNYYFQCCGSGTFIPDTNFFHPGSEVFSSIKEFKYFNPKKWFLGSQKYDPGCSSRIWILIFSSIQDPGSRGEKGTGSRIRFRNTDYFKKQCSGPKHYDPDPGPCFLVDADPSVHFDADPDPAPFKVMQICDH
jgi:hypothetical protein